jgi:DNA-3-methyladenine glycosylase
MISRCFFQKDPVDCARALVGCRLRWGACTGIVVETEAYDTEGDAACHTAFRPGARAFVRNHGEGTAYVYFAYGMHWMLNVLVKGCREGFVLIRAVEPLRGLRAMRVARGVTRDSQLCSGPGKLTQAMGVTGAHHGLDLCRDPGFGFQACGEAGPVAASPRIGITRAAERPWRFHLVGNAHVSGSKQQNRIRAGTPENEEAGRK